MNTNLWKTRRYVDSAKVQNTTQALPTVKELLYGRAKGWQAAKGGAA